MWVFHTDLSPAIVVGTGNGIFCWSPVPSMKEPISFCSKQILSLIPWKTGCILHVVSLICQYYSLFSDGQDMFFACGLINLLVLLHMVSLVCRPGMRRQVAMASLCTPPKREALCFRHFCMHSLCRRGIGRETYVAKKAIVQVLVCVCVCVCVYINLLPTAVNRKQ